MLSWFKTINSIFISKKAFSLIHSSKGVSSLPSFCLKAGMALEGCLVFPLFIFFMITLLYSLEMVRFQSDVYEAMHLSGSRECFYAYQFKYGESEGAMASHRNTAIEDIHWYLENQTLPYLCAEGGKEGVHITADSDNSGNIRICTEYVMKPFIRWIPIGNIAVSDCFYGHKFVGYMENGTAGEGSGMETYVYITATGSKYHVSQECTYLKVQIQSLEGESISAFRNHSGEKYSPCERCNPHEKGMVYLTEWGNKYHGKADCSALKRTVYLVPLSEVSNRTACSKCG